MTDSRNLKDTVCLPQTEFPMKANLGQLEPHLLERWSDVDLWGQIRKDSRDMPPFILHDGPPYANGHLHIGHALNKILKDIINRNFQKMGFDANYVPGWDCHGLPIEWKIEEKYRAENRDKDGVPINEFRGECRRFAAYWMGVQSEEFQRLGVFGDWQNPYSTMTFAAEATIVREIGKFLQNGAIIRRERPVLWSVVEQTALADAEVEYEEVKSPSITVRFPVVQAHHPALGDCTVLAWTTTPWTLPCNRAMTLNPELDYAVIRVVRVADASRVRPDEKVLLAEGCVARVMAESGVEEYEHLATVSRADLEGSVLAHPLRAKGYDHDVPVLFGDHVTTDQGSGCVHTAPNHGGEDFAICQAHGITSPPTVLENGGYHAGLPEMDGHVVIDADGNFGSAKGQVIRLLQAEDALFFKGSVRQRYPHSWRSKKPVIYLATAQWFIDIEHDDLRQRVLEAIERTRFYPARGQNRLRSLIETRPDWCISRQRSWGVPIAIFVDRRSGAVLDDPEVMERIVVAFEQEGADCWFDNPASRFLGDAHDPDDYEQVFDVVDVWFDSGSSHAFVLEARDDLYSPATLYLEGSDQHRGFFQSSILQSVGTRGRAPYENVLTHGFTLDEQGRKMSKSVGNTITPQQVIDQYGAEILRLWVANLDYGNDVHIGDTILKGTVDIYRRMRNTLRWLMGNLHHYNPERRTDPEDMPELEKLLLHRISQLGQALYQHQQAYNIQEAVKLLFQFCNQDLSAFYFDIRKDALYCDAIDDHKRLAALSMIAILFDVLCVWLSPILTFTAEEAWLVQTGDDPENSIHRRNYPKIPVSWQNPTLAWRWNQAQKIRKVVLGALEQARQQGFVKSALEAHPVIFVASQELYAETEGIDFAELCITPQCTLKTEPPPKEAFRLDDLSDVAVVIERAVGQKCARCWKVTQPDPAIGGDDPLCSRCTGVLRRDFEWF